jgi:hypothetical protein
VAHETSLNQDPTVQCSLLRQLNKYSDVTKDRAFILVRNDKNRHVSATSETAASVQQVFSWLVKAEGLLVILTEVSVLCSKYLWSTHKHYIDKRPQIIRLLLAYMSRKYSSCRTHVPLFIPIVIR